MYFYGTLGPQNASAKKRLSIHTDRSSIKTYARKLVAVSVDS